MSKKLSIAFALCCVLTAPAFASDAPAVAAAPLADVVFGADATTILERGAAEARVDAKGRGGEKAGCTATATCRDGSTISCSSSGSSTACSSADHNCPYSHGWVKCGPIRQCCPAQCPISDCPYRQGCQYQLIIASGCCENTLHDPNTHCPDLCQ
ncbi:MAG: hypothetical protein MI919_02045 [Holophagales bacterium]|nr:hypothetical protein [Holophagales bacterium]